MVECPLCRLTGLVNDDWCPTCHGMGKVPCHWLKPAKDFLVGFKEDYEKEITTKET